LSCHPASLATFLAIPLASQLSCHLSYHPTCLPTFLSLVLPSNLPRNLLATCLAIQLASQLACNLSCHPAVLSSFFQLALPLSLNKLMLTCDNLPAPSILHGRLASLLAFHLSVGRRLPIIVGVVSAFRLYCCYIMSALS
jgi:hypothetical protein